MVTPVNDKKEGDPMDCPSCGAPDRQYWDPNLHPVNVAYPDNACWFNLWEGWWECGECLMPAIASAMMRQPVDQ